jgi:hypothetical protein
MHQIYHHTLWSSPRFSHWMVPTLGMDSYTNQLRLIHSRRLVLMVLTRLNPSKYLPTFSRQTNFFNSIGQASLTPFPWSSEEEWRHYLSGDTISTLPVMYTGPPPSAPTYSTPTISPLSILSRSIIQSSAKLFFISHSIGTNDAREWRLVRVALQESMSSYPSCLQDGRFLVKFYISVVPGHGDLDIYCWFFIGG